MKVKNVKADSLASVFTDSTLSAFTQNAINKGVTDDSVIYIVCGSSDAATYGSQYTEGSHWIWAKGDIFRCDEEITTEDIESENLDDISIVLEGRDTLTENQLLQVDGVLSERFWFGTQNEYNALQTTNPTTIYFIEKA